MKYLIITLVAIVGLQTNNIFAQLTLPYTFENNSRYADSEIYIGLVGKTNELGDVWMDMTSSELKVMSANDNTIPGPEWSFPQDWLYPEIFTKLSDIQNNTIQIPHGLFGCRIFISFESPMYLRFHDTGGYAGANLSNPGDPNTGIRWEIVELTWGDAGLWTNTSRVDAYQYPMGLEVNGFFGGIDPNLSYEELYNAGINGAGTPQFKKIGEVLSHQEILEAWDNTVSDPYLVAKIIKEQSIDGEPIIEQPSKVHEFPDNVLDSYIDDIWETFKNYDLVLDIGDRGIWRGRIDENDVLRFTDPADGSIASIYGKPSTIDALEGAGFLASSNSTNPDIILEDLMIQAQISAAITRHAIYTNIIDGSVQDTHDADRFFQIAPYNEYVKFFHSEAISFESQTYAFAYDDVGDHSSTIQSTFPTDVKVVIGGYGETPALNELTSIDISPKNSTILVNENLQLTAQGLDQNGSNFDTPITWETSGGTISDNGLFSSSQSGTYTITASSGDISSSTQITVNAAAPVLTSIDVTPKNANILTNENLQLAAQGLDQNGSNFDTPITWETSGGTISDNGLFSSSQNGTYTITASSGDISASTQITVNATAPVLTSIDVTPKNANILTNENLELTAQGLDQNGSNFDTPITWETSGGTISDNGLFSSSQSGTYTITASSGDISSSTQITVNAAAPVLTSIDVTPKNANILTNENLQLAAQGLDQNGSNFDTPITWETSGGTISDNGLFSSSQNGTYTITASSGDISSSTQITVNAAAPVLTSIDVTPKNANILTNENLELTAQGLDQNGSNFDTPITWETSGGTISDNGLFSSSQSGTYTITASSVGISSSTQITVNAAAPVLTSIEITPKEANILINEALQFSAQGIDQYGNNIDIEVIWSTNGGTIGTDGLFSSYETGVYTITATSENISGNTQITISQPPPVLTSIEISPENSTIKTNENLQFTAQGIDQYNENIDTDISWSVISGEANITTNGIFSTSIAGDYIIRAAQGNIYTDTTIKVTQDTTTETCSGMSYNGDFNYELSTNSEDPSIIFSPLNNTNITEINIHYSVDSTTNFSSHSVEINEAFQLNTNDGSTVYFYYTYNLEEDKKSNMYSFQTGNCENTIGVFDNGDDTGTLKNNYAVFPNPTDGKKLHITGLTENSTVNFFNLEGKLVRTDQTTNVDHIIIKPSELAYGFYIVTITSNESDFRKNFKLIVN